MWKPSPIHQYLVVITVVMATTAGLLLLRDILTVANSSLIYLLIVLLIAIRSGTGPSLLAAVICFLSFNFFLIKPYYTFLVSDSRELLDLVVFLLVAFLGGQLASNARQQAENARQRANEKEILHKLASLFNQLSTREGVYEALQKVLSEELHTRHVHMLPYATGVMPTDQTVCYLVLGQEEKVYGTLCVAFNEPPTESQLSLLNTSAIQARVALERIELTEKLSRTQTIEEADRLKTALLHAVSHDLRTPITIIKTSAASLLSLRQHLDGEQQNEMLTVIENEADQLDRMVGNLLDMSRLQAGALYLHLELNSLEEVIGDVVARMYQLHKAERITMNFPDDMPLAKFDYGLMLQAITNLVENALRYEPAESKIEVNTRVDHDQQIVSVSVVNHGPTILPEVTQHLFEPFYHGPGGNIGLGLAITKGIIEAHQGQIRVQDTPGGGATFMFTLALPADSTGGIV
ncbi:MAG: DUF4118 domain-containing protein [Anaerolineae bacterium]|nr:DUF4118 domain-containing protein [Anaerolineae bacterium]